MFYCENYYAVRDSPTKRRQKNEKCNALWLANVQPRHKKADVLSSLVAWL